MYLCTYPLRVLAQHLIEDLTIYGVHPVTYMILDIFDIGALSFFYVFVL